MPRSLPEHASIKALKKQAKSLLKARQQANPEESIGLQECQHLLAKEYGFEKWENLKRQVLFQACVTGNLCAVKEWLAAGGDLEFRQGKGDMTPLMAASSYGDLAVVKALVEAGANVSAVNGSESTALGFASWPGHLEIVEYLLQNDADNNRGMPLQQAASHGNLDVVKALVEAGADLNAIDEDGGTALSWAADPGRFEVIKYLVEHGADVNAGKNALATACENGHLDIARYLIDAGAGIEAGLGEHDMTPLVAAAINDHRDVVDLLLERGADLHAKGDFALEWAAQLGKTEMVDYLLSLGADINAGGPLGIPVLQQVTDDGKLKIVKFLVERGADSDLPSPDGTTARAVAVDAGQTQIIAVFDAMRRP